MTRVATPIAALVAVAAACGGGGRRAAPSVAADEVLAPVVVLHFGGPIAELRAARPSLEPTGWREGTQETFLDATIAGGLEIETDAGTVHGATLRLAAERGDEVEFDVRKKLGTGLECAAPMPDSIEGYRPTLWRTNDDGAVTLLRKKSVLVVRVEKPASPSFAKAWERCREQ